MTSREGKQIRKRVVSASGHRSLRRSARRAALNAQRASRVLDIPYTILKSGVIYTVHKDKWVEAIFSAKMNADIDESRINRQKFDIQNCTKELEKIYIDLFKGSEV